MAALFDVGKLRLPFPDATFDRAIVGPVVLDWAAPTAWTVEVRRVLKPGSELLVVDTLATGVVADATEGDDAKFVSQGLLEAVEAVAEIFALDSAQLTYNAVALRAFRETAETGFQSRFLKSLIAASSREFVRIDSERQSQRDELDRVLSERNLLLQQRNDLRQALALAEVRLDERALLQQSLETQLGALRPGLLSATAPSRTAPTPSASSVESELRSALERTEVQLQRERWKLASLKQRKWHRMGSVLAGAARRPWMIPTACLKAGAIALSRSKKPLLPPSGTSAETSTAESASKQAPKVSSQLLEWLPPYDIKPEWEARKWIKVASVLDEFSELAFQFECQLLPVPRTGWKEILKAEKPDLLLVESAWNGNKGAWQYAFTGSQAPKEDLIELVEWCKSSGITTIFWNKEDPLEYDSFIESARHFDWVFTVDEACVERYRRDLKHQRVGVLPFAVQPAIHNPVNSFRTRPKDVAFAGAYYSTKYPERKEQIESILVPCVDLGLEIFSRFATDPKYQFPAPLDATVVGSLSYERMLTAYRRYKVFLNVNSVTDSETMFSRRVLELAACGTPVVSGPSPGMEAMVHGGVLVSTNAETTKLAVKSLLRSAELRDRMAVKGIRSVFSNHTYRHRLEHVLRQVGFDVPLQRRQVSVVAATNKPGSFNEIIDNVSRQRHPDIELIVALHGIAEDEAKIRDLAAERGIENLSIVRVSEDVPLGGVLNRAIDIASGEFIAKMDDDDFYGGDYLSDQLLAFDYTRADIVGKWTRFIRFEATQRLGIIFPGSEHKYTKLVGGGTILAKRYVFDHVNFPERTVGEDTHFLNACSSEGILTYSTDRFNFVYRRQANPESHTYAVNDLQHLANTKIFAIGASDAHAVN